MGGMEQGSQRLRGDTPPPHPPQCKTRKLSLLMVCACQLFMLSVAATRVLAMQDVPKDKEYKLRLKGMNCCFAMLKNALTGSSFCVFSAVRKCL